MRRLVTRAAAPIIAALAAAGCAATTMTVSSHTSADDGDRQFVYDEGTLVVDLVDPRAQTLVWRGWAESSFEGAIDDQAWMEARIDEAVARILERLPRGL